MKHLPCMARALLRGYCDKGATKINWAKKYGPAAYFWIEDENDHFFTCVAYGDLALRAIEEIVPGVLLSVVGSIDFYVPRYSKLTKMKVDVEHFKVF